jgi:hypothetical protein
MIRAYGVVLAMIASTIRRIEFSGFVRTLFTTVVFGLMLAAISAEAIGQMAQPGDTTKSSDRQESSRTSILNVPTFIIVDDPNRVGDLFQKLDRPEFQLIRPDKVNAENGLSQNSDTFVKSVSIRGKTTGSIADLTIVMEIQQSRQGSVWTPIGLDGLVLRSIRSGDQPVAAMMARPGGPWQIRTDTAGTHKIEIELGTEIAAERSTRRLIMSIPEAASTDLAIEVPEQVLFATTNARDSLQTRFDAARNVYLITGLLTPRARLELRWMGQSLIRTDDRIRLECRGQVAIRMDLEAVSTRQYWQIRPLTGFPATLSFEMPESETLVDIFVDGQATRPRFEKTGMGSVVVSIDNPGMIKGPNSDPITVELSSRLIYPAGPGVTQNDSREIPWRAPRWNSGEIVTGIVALEMPDRWVHTADRQSAFEPVDTRDLSDRLKKTTNQVAFRFSGAESTQTFRIRRRKPPLFTDVRTIGIVRRAQTEYVSDIMIQGEIDPLRDYEIELDRAARPLFVGPRDIWERYEFVGDSGNGERKLRRLKLTPNRNLKPETPASLRIRYLRRSDEPESFSVSLPRFVESTGESYRTWLLPEPSIEIEPIDSTQPVRRQIPPQDSAQFTNLLEQSLSDEDKWIKPRNATDLNCVFFRFANIGERDFAFRKIVRPPSLDYVHQLVLRPTTESIGIRHIFECVVEKGLFDRVVVTPAKENPIRNLRYTLSHDGTNQTGNVIIQNGSFEIPLPAESSRRFTLTLEAIQSWSNRKNPTDKADQSDNNDAIRFEAAHFDFSIEDGARLQRGISVEDTSDFVARISDDSKSWANDSLIDSSATSGKVRSWTAADAKTPWPEVKVMPLATRSENPQVNPIRSIDALLRPGTSPLLTVSYVIEPGTRELRLEHSPEWSAEFAEFQGIPLDVAETGKSWSILLPSSFTNGTLNLRCRSRIPVGRISLPIPTMSPTNSAIKTRLKVVHSSMERVIPLFLNGWNVESAATASGTETIASVTITDEPQFVTFRTSEPGKVLPIRKVPLPMLLIATFIGGILLIALARYPAGSGQGVIPVIAALFVSALLVSDRIGPMWAGAAMLGILTAVGIIRATARKPRTAEAAGSQSSLARRPAPVTVSSSLRNTSVRTLSTSEPSTVLKRLAGEGSSGSFERIENTSTSDPATEITGGDSRWSLPLDSPAARSGSGISPGGKPADPSR